MIDLRVLTPDDWRDWRALRLAALAEAPDAFGARLADWQGEADHEERWRDRLGIPGSYNVLALRAAEPVGMVSGVPTPATDTAELISMWVAPAARGRGVGDALLAEVERWARTTGARTLRLGVMAGNTAAAGLYARHGFTPTGAVEGDGDRREVVLAKQLAG